MSAGARDESWRRVCARQAERLLKARLLRTMELHAEPAGSRLGWSALGPATLAGDAGYNPNTNVDSHTGTAQSTTLTITTAIRPTTTTETSVNTDGFFVARSISPR